MNAKLIQYFHLMTFQKAEQELSAAMSNIYDKSEALVIAGLVMEIISGRKKMDRIMIKEALLSAGETSQLEQYTKELVGHKPVQYVLQEAWFYGLRFYVNEHVLIPRPETEELVKWISEEPWVAGQSLLDIGTGSGCIAIALKKVKPELKISACDISTEALEVARRNAHSHDAIIDFLQIDILNPLQRHQLPYFDCIAANPPYVPNRDKNDMSANVLDFEPHQALFVPDEEPLIFYNAIADFGLKHLLPGGDIFVEVHEKEAGNVKKLFSFAGFSSIEIKMDMQGKPRLLKATRLL
jgi:release factor glutamine methyltransferase